MLSVVVPVFNEDATIEELVQKLLVLSEQHHWLMQIILVDDGSQDRSWSVIRALAERYSNVEGIRFRRNFGKAAALAAGIDRSQYSVVVTLDADLQDDPEEIPKLIGQLEDGHDVVSGWKRNRRDPWTKRLPSKVFNSLVNRLTGVKLHDHNCGLKAYRREVFREVQLYGEMHRFVPVLAAARGWRVTEIPVTHYPRKHGKSKYGTSRFIKGFLDLLTVYFLTGYRHRPQHFLGTIGLLSFLVGFVGLGALSVGWVFSRLSDQFSPIHLHQKAIFYYAIVALLAGMQLLSVGFLAELITLYGRPNVIPYSVAETTSARAEVDSATE